MLPTCPACKQSVLDDDATECPFCGADMKTGKGGVAKPAAPAKSAKAEAKSSPSVATSAKPPSSDKSSNSSRGKSILDDDDDDPFSEKEDDDPFAVATREAAASKANAIKVSPKKTKTYTEELKCPMCDTVGYVPEGSGGKDVKCCNPECRVPVFMAPKKFAAPVHISDKPAKPKKSTEPAGPSKKPLILAVGGGVALVAIVGAVVYFWPPPAAPKSLDFKELAEKARQERLAKGLPEASVDLPPSATDVQDAQSMQAAADANQAGQFDVAGLLRLMQDRSLEEKLAFRRYCRQRTAIAYALIGDLAGMNSQFKALDELEKKVEHFRLPAYMALGWQQFLKDDKAAAKATLAEAMGATSNLGKGSRETQQAVIELAALQVALGQSAEARKVLAAHITPDDATPLAVMMALARHRGDFDVDQDVPGGQLNPHLSWPEYGTTLVLTTHGLWEEARTWAESLPDVQTKSDCLIAWADARLRDALARKQPVDSSVEKLTEKLPPGGQVQLLGRLALTHAKHGDAAEAARLLTAAQGLLKALPVPPVVRIATFKDVLNWTPGEVASMRQAAIGAAAIGLAQAELKQVDAGWLSVIDGLNFARGTAPSPAAVTTIRDEVEALDLDPLRDRVRRELELRSRDEAIRKTRELQNKLNDLDQAAANRIELEENLLLRTAENGMAKQIWSEILSLSQRTDPNDREPYLRGKLPGRLQNQFQLLGMAAEANEISEHVEADVLTQDYAFELQRVADAAVKANSLNDLVATINQFKLTGGMEEVAMKGLVRYAKQNDQALAALKAIEAIDIRAYNLTFKQEALQLLGAYAGRRIDPNTVRTAIQNLNGGGLDRISAFLGLIEGWTVSQQAAAKKAPAATETPSPSTAEAKPGK